MSAIDRYRSEPATRRGRRRPLTVFVASASLVVVLLPQLPVMAASNVTAITSDGGQQSLVGEIPRVFTPANATISIGAVGDGSGGITWIRMSASAPGTSFSARVDAPTGQALAPGTYATTSSPTATEAGFDVGGDRSCNSTGTLTIHELSFVTDPSVAIEHYAATYEQVCLGHTEPFFGELRYDSSVDFKAATVDPFALNFGQDYVGTALPALPLTITNAGTLAMTLGTAELTGPASGDFSITSDACSGETLAPAANCVMEASFTPGDIGQRTATIHLDDQTVRGGRDIPLYGEGFMNFTATRVRVSRSSIRFGQTVVLTAHLTGFEQTISKEVEIHARPYGGTYALLTSGDVDENGNLSVTFAPRKKTTFIAKFLGDEHSLPATSPVKTVYVSVSVTGSMIGAYGSSGAYKLYHFNARCPNRGRGCPTYVFKVTPNHSGANACALLQVRTGGVWRTATDCVRVRLNADSKAAVTWVYGGPGVIGLPTRVRAQFRGDADHVGANARWAYFKVTR